MPLPDGLVENTVGLVEKGERLVDKVTENQDEVTENQDGVIENQDEVIEKVKERAELLSIKVTENRLAIIREIIRHPNVSKAELSKVVGISVKSISENIDAMRDKIICRIGPDKGGRWEVVID